eukprot:scaffold2986_cov249-Pinguiococcus_pyrenoidosus.AAC.4
MAAFDDQATDAELAVRDGVAAPVVEDDPNVVNDLGLRVVGDRAAKAAAELRRKLSHDKSAEEYKGDEGMVDDGGNLHAKVMRSTGIKKGHVAEARRRAFGDREETEQDVGAGVKLYTTKMRDPMKFEFEVENLGQRAKVLTLDLSASQNLVLTTPPQGQNLRVVITAPSGMERTTVAIAEPGGYGNVTMAASLFADEDVQEAEKRAKSTAATPGLQQGETVKARKIQDVATLYTYTCQRPPSFRWEVENHKDWDIEFTLDLSGSENLVLKRPEQEDMQMTVLVPKHKTVEIAAAGIGRLSRASVKTNMSIRQLAPTAPQRRDSQRTNHMVAAYDYQPDRYDEVELREGDEVFVQQRREDGWATVVNKRLGRSGLVPLNHLKQYGNATSGAAPAVPEQHRRGEDWASDGGKANEVMYQGRKCVLLGETDGVCTLQALDTREMIEAPVAEVEQLNPNTVSVQRAVPPAEAQETAAPETTDEAAPAPPARVIPGIRVDGRSGVKRDAETPSNAQKSATTLRSGNATREPEDERAIPRHFRKNDSAEEAAPAAQPPAFRSLG